MWFSGAYQICRVCHKGGGSVAWFGWESYEYWVHRYNVLGELSCCEPENTNLTNLKSLLAKFTLSFTNTDNKEGNM